ncbi:hypothetical protein [Burkholderia cenocepacia]|uniref:hypothetical protein n=1 Tax=Burkholderia cenocepacia TaxID=95486 RepID=UPI000761762F|nr:hypothetical protein [Burkholderia cenocepacia]KWU26354.1 hypothetical protein AS149_25530 [Burkholderia cenocepacia]
MPHYELVLLETRDDYIAEGKALNHALSVFYDHFVETGTVAYSLRADGKPLLTLSVRKEKYTDHIVGHMNRAPTPEEFEVLNPLLVARGIENRYRPDTIY